MAKSERELGTATVRQANALAKSAQLMDLNEKRLLFLAMSRIRWDDKDFLTCELLLSEIQEWFGGNPYQEVRRTADSLLKRVVHVQGDEGAYKKFQWTTLSEYIPSSQNPEGVSVIRLRFNNELKPFLLSLRERYNTMPLKPLLLLSSFNAQRLYEVLWHDSHGGKKKFLTYKLDDLKLYLGLRDPQGRWEKYESWRDLRKLLLRLQKVIAEIGPLRIIRFTGLKVKSRSYNCIRFELDFDQSQVPLHMLSVPEEPRATPSPEMLDLAQAMREAGFNQDPFTAIEQYGFEVVQRTLKAARKAERDAATTSNPIRNLGGLIVRMLQRGAVQFDIEMEKTEDVLSSEDAAIQVREWADAYNVALAEAASSLWESFGEETQDEVLGLMRVELNPHQLRALDRINWRGPSFISSRNIFLFRTFMADFPAELEDFGSYIKANALLGEYSDPERELLYREIERL